MKFFITGDQVRSRTILVEKKKEFPEIYKILNSLSMWKYPYIKEDVLKDIIERYEISLGVIDRVIEYLETCGFKEMKIKKIT